jgi:Bifunctional DNA primase/polymerase, N-terminal
MTRESAPRRALPRSPAKRIQADNTAAEPALLDAAVEYATRHIDVFPCMPGGKRPLVEHGLYDASSDADVIRSWWSRWPTANIGTPTGSMFHVLDIDGPAGVETLRALASEHGRPDNGPLVRTSSGMSHYYFAPPARGVGNRARFITDCDWRGFGGYVVVPPSIGATGRRYEWKRGLDTPLPEVPDWLLDLLDPPRPSLPARRAMTGSPRYAEAALDAEVRNVADAPVGARNHTLNIAAFNMGTLVGAGLLNMDAVIEALYHAARRAGLSEREIVGARGNNGTLMSGLRSGFNHPREVTR